MRRHWQREPLLLRGAFPRFRDPLSVREVLALAASEAARSRLVRRARGGRWTLEHGPFSPARLKQLPRRDWTLLVQDTNHFSDRSDRVLSRFGFIAHARLDDLMVSYAVPGGTVGPHADSYDVFLLQGHGRRRWQVSRQRDTAFVPGLPLKILERFRPEREWVLESGDMLYLPPGVSHYGVAESECLTWSIGFRAPSNAEIRRGLLDFLHDRAQDERHYRDPGIAPVAHPGEVPPALAAHVAREARRIRWTAGDVRDFTGRFLTEPKADVYFDAPHRGLPFRAFSARAGREGVALDRRSRLAFSGSMFYMNGEAVRAPSAAVPALRRLADERRVAPGTRAPADFWRQAHAWHSLGYLHLGAKEDDDE